MADEKVTAGQSTEKAPAKKEKDLKKGADRKSVWQKISKFFKDFASELKKIVWLPWKNVKSDTALVLVSVVVISAVIGLLDYLLSNGIILLGRIV